MLAASSLHKGTHTAVQAKSLNGHGMVSRVQLKHCYSDPKRKNRIGRMLVATRNHTQTNHVCFSCLFSGARNTRTDVAKPQNTHMPASPARHRNLTTPSLPSPPFLRPPTPAALLLCRPNDTTTCDRCTELAVPLPRTQQQNRQHHTIGQSINVTSLAMLITKELTPAIHRIYHTPKADRKVSNKLSMSYLCTSHITPTAAFAGHLVVPIHIRLLLPYLQLLRCDQSCQALAI